MKLAIIGTGKIVEDALPALKEVEGIHLQTIISTPRSIEKAKALAKSYGIAEVSDQFESAIKSSAVDTVYVATPNHLHYAMAKQALLAGKHVICEKPFTMTLAELDDLIQIAKANKVILLEAITNQYLGNFHFMKEHLQQLGDIKIVECNYSQYSSRYDAFKQGEIAPAFDPEKGGGALRDLNIYNIHIIVGLFGLPKSVNYLPNIERQIDTSGILVLDYQNFKVIAIAAKDCSAEIRSTIQGNKGSMVILGATNTVPQLALSLNGHDTKWVNANQHEHRMVAEFEAFEAIIAKKDYALAESSLKYSYQVMTVLEKALESLL